MASSKMIAWLGNNCHPNLPHVNCKLLQAHKELACMASSKFCYRKVSCWLACLIWKKNIVTHNWPQVSCKLDVSLPVASLNGKLKIPLFAAHLWPILVTIFRLVKSQLFRDKIWGRIPWQSEQEVSNLSKELWVKDKGFLSDLCHSSQELTLIIFLYHFHGDSSHDTRWYICVNLCCVVTPLKQYIILRNNYCHMLNRAWHGQQ